MKRFRNPSIGLMALMLSCLQMAIAHGPDQAPHRMANLGELALEGGGTIKNLRMSYVTHGRLNSAKDNAILLLHGFGANHHLFDHLIGSGKPLDTDKYFIIASDALGNTQTGFEHSTSPTNSGLKMKFPAYNGRDMVKAQYKLVTEGLGTQRVLAIAGISMGADHAVQFAVSYPDFMSGIVPMVGSAIWGSQGFLYLAHLESIIESCQGWDKGNYREISPTCGANAIQALIPFFYSREWWDENITTPESFEKWRKAWGDYYIDVQDARDLYYLSKAMGRGWVGDTPGFNGDLNAALKSIKAKTVFIVSPYDQFFMPKHISAQTAVIPNSRVVSIDSNAGHLICCNGDPQATWVMGGAIRGFLEELRPTKTANR